MLCYKDRHPLLLKYLMSFLMSICKVGGASDSSSTPLIVDAVSFSAKVDSQIACKTMTDLGYPISRENGVL